MDRPKWTTLRDLADLLVLGVGELPRRLALAVRSSSGTCVEERKFLIDNLLVRIHYIIVMIQ